jgi:hypothetical protein
MISLTSKPDGSLTLNASVNGTVIYLDTWAFIRLAKEDPSRRKRFIDAVHRGADILFSVTNAAELSGPKEDSAEAVKTFLDEIGPHWFPARLNPIEAVNLEIRGEDPGKVCVDEEFFKSYVADRLRDYSPGSGRVIHPTAELFSLAPIVDRLGLQRDSISDTAAQFDKMLKDKLTAARRKSKRDPSFNFKSVSFDPARPACFVFFNLLQIMAVDSNSLTKGDGLDFCHAVMGCAYATFTTLDSKWKRRIEKLPQPHGLPRVYFPAELDQFVADIESRVAAPAGVAISC